MSVQNNVSFNGHVPRSEKRRNTRWALIGAPLVTATNIATMALVDSELRKDSFTATAKACAKDYVKAWRDIFAGGAKYIFRKDSWANAIKDIKTNNKYFAAGVLALDTLAMFGIIKMASDFGSKIRHRKD